MDLRFHIDAVNITDLAFQFWCEKKVELSHIYRIKPSYPMQKGRKFHEMLREEVFVHLPIVARNFADYIYKEGYESYFSLKTLNTKGICRELPVRGLFNKVPLVGKIDELNMNNDKIFIVENKTENNLQKGFSNNENVRSYLNQIHVIQVMLYKYVLDQLVEGKYTINDFNSLYDINSLELSQEFKRDLEKINLDKELKSIEGIYKKLFEEFSNMKLGDTLFIRYYERDTKRLIKTIEVKYNKEEIENKLRYAIDYWLNKREANPVSKEESWKCLRCEFFRDKCKVWAHLYVNK